MTGTLFIRKNNRHVKIQTGDILFIHAQGSYLEIVTRNDKYPVSLNLSQFLRKNSITSLVRIHRSYIINIQALDAFDHRFAYVDQHRIPIGESYRSDFIRDINLA